MSTSAVKNISLLLIRIGRWVAKKTRLENNSLVLFLYEQVLKGITSPNNSMQSVRYWNHDFILASDLSILPGLLNKTYEKQELAYVQKTLQSGQIFYDIGANFGLYSVLASQTVGANGCVYAFEPAPETYKNLQKNTQSLKNIKAFPCAVGAENGTLQLHFDSNKPGCSSALTSLGQAATAVPVIKIDTFLQEGKIQPADFIKIDVEGYEYEVLQGLMSSVKPNTVILCEFNPSFLRHVGRNPQDFLDFVHSNFKSVHFIHELNGQLLPITKEQDLRGQIVSNLVLKEPSAAGR